MIRMGAQMNGVDHPIIKRFTAKISDNLSFMLTNPNIFEKNRLIPRILYTLNTTKLNV